MTATVITVTQAEIDAYVSESPSFLPPPFWRGLLLSKRISDAGFEVNVLSVVALKTIRVRGCRVVLEYNDERREVRVLIDREVAA